MEGYRPAFDIDTGLADAETADVELVDTRPAGAEPAHAPHKPASVEAKRFGPSQFPLSEPYSLDGITAIIPAEVFRRPKDPR